MNIDSTSASTPSHLVPGDAHDEALLAHVHPRDWVNPEPEGRYNLVVIGAGVAGLVTAAGAAGMGARVALIERHLMGGDCLNAGCVPSKAILSSAHAVGRIREAGALGVELPAAGVQVDFSAVMRRMREVRSRISHLDSAARFRDELGVDVFLGQAAFSGPDTIRLPDRTLQFKTAVIATGSRAFVPPIPGLVEAGYYTNETIFAVTELPARLAIIGGGPIGCELAQAFARFGSQVTLIEMETQFLPREDPEAAQILRRALEADGIDLHLSSQVSQVVSRGSTKLVTLETDGKQNELEVDAILVGAGRAPNVEDLGLDSVGVETHRGGVVVDDHLRTSNKNIFAAGDVALSQKFTHVADFAARIVIQNALFFGRKKFSDLTIPWCTYTQPEIAHVGIYGHEAAEQGIPIDSYRKDFSDVDRAIAEGEEVGFVKIHTKKGSDQIVGATIVGSHAGDMISEISVAMAGGVGLSKMASVIHPYPTQAEAIRQLGDAFNRTRLTPWVATLIRNFLALRR